MEHIFEEEKPINITQGTNADINTACRCHLSPNNRLRKTIFKCLI